MPDHSLASAGPMSAEARRAMFAAALRQHQAGNLAEAEQAYLRVLDDQDDHADCHHLLGVVALQRGDDALAAARIERAIAIDGNFAAYHSNLAEARRRQGRLDEALASCRRALALAPDGAEAHVNLGVVQEALGQDDAALASFRRAIALAPGMRAGHGNLTRLLNKLGQTDDAIASLRAFCTLYPEDAQALVDLGTALLGSEQPEQLEQAAAALRQAAALRPDMADAHERLCHALNRLKQPEAALVSGLRAVELHPDDPQKLNTLGNLLRELGDPHAAVHCHRRALELRADFAPGHNDLGLTMLELGQPEEALACFRRAVACKPEFIEAEANIGNALVDLRRLDEAVALYRDVIRRQPNFAAVHGNLGNVLVQQGMRDAAVAHYRQAIALKPDFAEAHTSLAFTLLALGDLAAGWLEFEWRWETAQARGGKRMFAQRQWRGEPAAGRTLLLHGEQGFGDVLQFCRYAPLAAAAGFRVIVEVSAPLVRLMRSLDGVDRVVPWGEAPPDFDLHCPMLSAPLAFGTQLATIPGQVGYLRADPAAASRWQARLAGMTGPRVGLCWAGNPREGMPQLTAIDRRRSMAPALLAPLFDLPGVTYFSLQKDGPPPPDKAPLIDFMPEMTDFADTAALVANLDLVIAVDSAVAHLAAALGRPVWLLDRFDNCWRWLTGRRDSPWYPTLRIYRQTVAGDWNSVIAEVAADLGRLA